MSALSSSSSPPPPPPPASLPPPLAVAMLPRSCEVCRKQDNLLRCAGCQAVYYCGRDHQAADRASHKRSCSATKKARIDLRHEEQKLRDRPGDWSMPDHVFENGVGHFWGIMETRPYMHSRFQLVDKLLQNFGLAGGRAHIVQACLEHLLDMIRLCRSDNMGVRDLVPALYTRLGRDQEAYDFAKWYATTGDQPDQGWGLGGLPVMDIKDADIFEPPIYWSDGCISLSHAAAVVLLKLRILLDLQAVQNAYRAFEGVFPQEIVHLIRVQLPGHIIRTRPGLLMAGPTEVARLIQIIRTHLKDMYRTIQQYNTDFWTSLLTDPSTALNSRPRHYSPGSVEEAHLVIGYNYAAWAETPGAIDSMKALHEIMTLEETE